MTHPPSPTNDGKRRWMRAFWVFAGLLAIAWWLDSTPDARPTREPEIVDPIATPGPASVSVPATSQAEPDVPPSEPAPETTDRFKDLPVIEEQNVKIESDQGTITRQTRLIRMDSYKYPLIRVEQDWLQSASAAAPRLILQRAAVADHLLVRPINPSITEEELLTALAPLDVTVRRRMPASGIWILAFPNPNLQTLTSAQLALAEHPNLLRYAEPDFIVHALTVPDDPSFGSLWGMDNTGQSGGTVDADIDAPEAWTLTTGSAAVVVGIIDTGIDYTHPDLAANAWVNPGEIPGNNIDDDSNGYIDDVHGWDFANDDADPMDDHDHGSHCSGTIGAVGNNGSGVVGVCWNVSLAGLKFLTASGSGSSSDAAEAIAYATMMGFDLTSNSWGGGGFSQSLEDVLNAADAAGILAICAAGNESRNNDSVANYPSNYNSDNIIAVASITRTDALSSFSNYGLTEVDLAAPGSEILSTVTGGRYSTFSGTSMATPHVAGVCALLRAWRPALTHDQIREIVLTSTVPIPALAGRCVTGGRLNAAAALAAADGLLVSLSPSEIEGTFGGPFAPSSGSLQLSNFSADALNWSVAVDVPWLTLSSTSGLLASNAQSSITLSLAPAVNRLPTGTHIATLTTTHFESGQQQVRQLRLRVLAPVVYENLLTADPNWTRQGEWAFGSPRGRGGVSFGFPDPSQAFTGANVFGIQLSGDYSVAVGSSQHLTLGPIDLSRHRDSVLEFRRWLNTDYRPWVEAAVEVSNNGSTWTSVWANGSALITDSTWSRQQIDVSSVADGSATVFVRWRHRVGTSDAYPLSGWNIDDVRLRATPEAQLNWAASEATVTEGDSPTTLTLRADPTPVDDLTLTFTTGAPSQLSAPASLTLPAGVSEINVPISAVDDALLDGTQFSSVIATASGYFQSEALVTIHDDESTTMSLTPGASLIEGTGPLSSAVTISLPQPADAPIRIALESSHPQTLSIPATIEIAAGTSSIPIPLTAPDNSRIDPPLDVLITATVTNWPPSTTQVQIIDDEDRDIELSLPAAIGEGTPPVTGVGTVRLAGTVTAGLTVTLFTPDTSWIQIPSSVTIPPGTSQASFLVTPINNTTVDGTQSYSITASASGFNSSQATAQVFDDELPSPALSPFPPDGATSVDPESDLSWTYTSGIGAAPTSAEVYFGESSALTSADRVTTTSSTSHALPRLIPGTTYFWRIDTLRAGDRFTGPVWSFQVAPVGAIDHFEWSTVPSPQWIRTPFQASLTARDAFNNIVTSFTGPAFMVPLNPNPVVISEVNPNDLDSIELTNVGTESANLSGWKIYPYHNAGGSTPMTPFTFPAGTQLAPGQSLTLLESGSSPGVFPIFRYGANIDWVSGTFSSSNVMAVLLTDNNGAAVDFMAATAMQVGNISQPFGIPTAQWSGATVTTSLANQSYLRKGSLDQNSAADWQLGSPSTYMTNPGLTIPFVSADQSPFLPKELTGFIAGVWSGLVTATKSGTHRMRAKNSENHTGLSNSFVVQSLGPTQLTLAPGAIITESDGIRTDVLTLTLPAAATTDLTVTVTSSDTSEIESTSFTLPSGSTSLPVPLSIADDSEIDGPRSVVLTVEVSRHDAASATVIVRDDEIGELTFHLPAEVTEGQGLLPSAASISVSDVVTAPLTIQLQSNDSTELQTVTQVIVPAGSDSASFDITVIDDALLDGSQTVLLIASVPGWPGTSRPLIVRDNESSALNLTLIAEGTEGDGTIVSGATVSVGGIVVADTTISVSSSDITEIGVPASVTIPAGLNSISFPVTLFDDDEADGTQTAAVTVQGLGQSTVVKTAIVRDNDPTSFVLSPIGGPHFDHQTFPFSVQAFDLNGTLLPKVTRTVDLTAWTGAGAPLPVTPSSLLGFVDGTWSGAVRVTATGAGLVLRVTCPTASAQSEPFQIQAGPRLRVSPSQMDLSIPSGEVGTRSLTIHNDGNAPLTWQINPSVGSVGVSTASNRDPRIRDNPSVATAPPLPDLADVLAVINGGHNRITDLIPNRWDFSNGITGNSIADGGRDMYDNGNYLATNLSPANTFFAYSDNQITGASPHAGAAGSYFTRKQPGLFVFAADLPLVTSFRVDGNLGADGLGQQSSTRLTTTREGTPWVGFVKRVYGTSDASVNHLIITPDQPSLQQSLGATTDSDTHIISGLNGGTTRLYHLVFSSLNGGFINDAQMQTIFEAFLDLTGSANWLNVDPRSGTLQAGTSEVVNVTFDASSLEPGFYIGNLAVVSNDPTALPAPTAGIGLTVTSTINHFEWTAIPANVEDDQSFTATLSAIGPQGNVVTDFTGDAELLAIIEELPPAAGGSPLPLHPTTVTLTNGVWSGSLAIFEPNPQVRLRAERNNHATLVNGSSDLFSVTPIPAPLLLPEPNFTRGTSNQLHWTAALPGEHQLQYALQPDFSDALNSPWLSDTSFWVDGLSEGSPYHYRLRRRVVAPLTPATPAGTFSCSDWSAAVMSQQDNQAPLIFSPLRVGVPHTTTRSTLLLTGTASDASGLQGLWVNDSVASTTDSHHTWSHPLLLNPGNNTITLKAIDQAETPPFTNLQAYDVIRVADDDGDALPNSWETAHSISPDDATGVHGAMGDIDLDGRCNLLEYAFNLRADHADASPCICQLITSPLDGARYLEFSYPRRFDTLDLDYTVIATTDLHSWSASDPQPFEIDTLQNPDGVSETVTVRIGPVTEVDPPRFIRVRVSTRP